MWGCIMNTEYKIEKLTDKEHIIRRPGMYIGSIISNVKPNNFVWCRDTKQFINRDMLINDGFVKIVNEVIDNGLDIILKYGGKKLDITFEQEYIEVKDDGIGFPVSDKQGEENPLVVALGNARAGSNFNDDTNIGQIGMNGVGAFATNCFSEEFIAISQNDSQLVEAKWENTELVEFNLKNKKAKRGTIIRFKPNYDMFGLDQISEDIFDEIYTRLVFVSTMYPKINITINGEAVDKIAKEGCVELNDKCLLWVKEGDIQQSTSSVNGLHVPEGNHIKYIYKILANHVNPKYKHILQNSVKVLVLLKGFTNPMFDSQTKTKLVNNMTAIGQYIGNYSVNAVKRALNRPEIIDALENALASKNQKDEKKLKKTFNNVKTDKYTPSVGKPKMLVIVEGDSALGGLCNALGRQGIAYYKLKGKILNTFDKSLVSASATTEVRDIISLVNKYDFEKVVFGTDQDLDGFHIRGLLLCLFNKFLTEYTDRIYFLQTPILGVMEQDEIVSWSYNLTNNLTGNVKYFKGLGSWSVKDLKKIIEVDTLEKMLLPINFDKPSDIRLWFSKDTSDERKEQVKDVCFDLSKI